jgi:phospholipid-binding lipoprotein MlaA
MRFRLLLLLAAGLLTSCASLPPGSPRDPRDPWERYNRAVFKFNDALDRNIAQPLAEGYVKVTPPPVRSGIDNFFNNLTYPTVIVNDLLQIKLKAFVSDTARLVLNTTLGIGGLFDPATQLGLPAGDEDFGQTLGHWGVPAGPYFLWPISGPSTVRDTVGWFPDQFTDPKTYAKPMGLRLGLNGMNLFLERVALLPTDDVVRRSFDPYVFMRNAYLQHREFDVKDGKVPDEEMEIFEEETTSEPAAAPAAGTAPQPPQ